MSAIKQLKAAVYTRVSTDHKLDDKFNSLQAQREAGEAYIKSQKSEGWSLVKDTYEDAGISGGTLKRPALRRLMVDVANGDVDIIVVYKVDRLSRSLSDFAKIIEELDTAGASFVSVTQQFNTSNSMGRLTLNMLLSFAQFEREVTAERIRDKVDASKKKGIWMGGPTPLGYKSIQKKLVIEPSEATTVRTIFEDYLSCSSIYELKHIINAKKLSPRGNKGKPFTQSSINYILKNQIYAGLISHDGKNYQGEHEAIICDRLWSKVQQKLYQQAADKHTLKRSDHISLLTGLLVDEAGNKLTPSYSCKGGKRYHYYITKELYNRVNVRRFSAEKLETQTIATLIHLLQTETSKTISKLHALILTEKLLSGTREEKRATIRKIASKIIVGDADIAIQPKESKGFPVAVIKKLLKNDTSNPKLSKTKRGTSFDQNLFDFASEAHKYLHSLISCDFNSIKDIAKHYKKDKSDISQHIRFVFLDPDIVTSICTGTQPLHLKATHLRKLKIIPYEWSEQKKLLGYTH